MDIEQERFPVEAWVEIFSTVPGYPLKLSDDLVREIANLAIHVRNMGEQLEEGISAKEPLVLMMPLSLISSAMKRIEQQVYEAAMAAGTLAAD